MIEQYSSVLAPCITSLISQKRINGFSYKAEARMLEHFDALCNQYDLHEVALTKNLVDLWSEQNKNENLNTRIGRISCLRQLAKHMASQGYPVYFPKPIQSGEKSHPYVLNHEELVALFDVIDNQVPNYKHPRRFIEEEKIMFRLFYCCGLRRSEVTNLRKDKIHIESGIIEILASKGDKDRNVFLPEDLQQMCFLYRNYIDTECPASIWFFPGKDDSKTFANSTLDVNFRRYWNKTPYAVEGGKHPTIHSLRHTFVVDKMNEWMEQGINLKTMLPYLSKYLGHSSINDTLYYYHLVDKAFVSMRKKDVGFASLIPEVEEYEEY